MKTTAKAQKSAEKMLAKAGKKNGKLAVTGPIYQASPQVNHARQWEGPLASNEVVAVAGIQEVRMIPKHFPMSPAGDSQWGIESLVHAHPKLRDRFPKIKKKDKPTTLSGKTEIFLENWEALTSVKDKTTFFFKNKAEDSSVSSHLFSSFLLKSVTTLSTKRFG